MTTARANVARALQHQPRIELYELDLTPIDPSAGIDYFHTWATRRGQVVKFQGKTYRSMPVQVSGFSVTGDKPPRPKVLVGNVAGGMTAIAELYSDLVGGILTRRVTFTDNLDDGDNPDPLAELVSVWRVARKSSEQRAFIEFELEAASDVQGVQLPRRVVQGLICAWLYEDGGTCGYTRGGRGNKTNMFELDDTRTMIAAEDRCGKRINSCRIRFDPLDFKIPLPFGAFPGTQRQARE